MLPLRVKVRVFNRRGSKDFFRTFQIASECKFVIQISSFFFLCVASLRVQVPVRLPGSQGLLVNAQNPLDRASSEDTAYRQKRKVGAIWTISH